MAFSVPAPPTSGGGEGGGDGITQTQGDARYLRRSQNLDDLADASAAARTMHSAGPLGGLWPLIDAEGNFSPWFQFTAESTGFQSFTVPDTYVILSNGRVLVRLWDETDECEVLNPSFPAWNQVAFDAIEGHLYRLTAIGEAD